MKFHFRSCRFIVATMSPALPYPALHATHGGIWIASREGEVRGLGRGEAISRAAETPVIMLNAPLIGQRLGYPDLSGLDLLELFAFVHPARSRCRRPRGLAAALGIDPPASDAEAAPFLLRAPPPCSRRWRRSGLSARGRGRRPRRCGGCAGRGRPPSLSG
jgi:ATP-dependent DNA helicase DinG